MKLFLLLSVLSLSAFANVDNLLGTYKAKDGDGTAVIRKTLVTDRTLFDPAVYAYEVEITRNKHEIERVIDLEVKGDTLVGSDRDDCDNPDCHAFDWIEVEAKKAARGAKVLLNYEGYDTEDGSDEVREFSGSAVFLK